MEFAPRRGTFCNPRRSKPRRMLSIANLVAAKPVPQSDEIKPHEEWMNLNFRLYSSDSPVQPRPLPTIHLRLRTIRGILIEPENKTIPVKAQCDLIALPRSTYYDNCGKPEVEPANPDPERLLLSRRSSGLVQPGRSCHGGCRTHQMRHSAPRHWRRRSVNMAFRKSSTRTRVRSSPLTCSSLSLSPDTSRSAWTGRDVRWTTYLWRDYWPRI